MTPDEELEREVARVIEPQAWRALGMCDTLAYSNRRTSSLRKAKAILERLKELGALSPPSKAAMLNRMGEAEPLSIQEVGRLGKE